MNLGNHKILSRFLKYAFLCAVALSVSCHLWTKDDTSQRSSNIKKIKKRQIEGIGAIVSINSELDFVLIDVRNPQLANQSSSYYIEKISRTAVLKPTGEKIGTYFAADIINGEVKLGDSVFVKLPKPPAPPEPEVTIQNSDAISATSMEKKADQQSTASEKLVPRDEERAVLDSTPSPDSMKTIDEVPVKAMPSNNPPYISGDEAAPPKEQSAESKDPQIKE